MLDFGDIDGLAVGAAEADIAWLLAEDIDLAQYVALRRQHRDDAFAVAGDIEVAVHVGAHAVEAEVVELLEKLLFAQRTVSLDGEGPDVALHAFVHIERLAIGADFDAV